MSVSVENQSNVEASVRPVPRLDEGAEFKILRCDVAQWEGDWDPPAKYDAGIASEILQSHVEDAVEAEKLGFDGVMTTEHHFDGWTLIPSPNVYLSAVAARTSRIRLGQTVQVLPFHSPWRLAEEVGMLDALSGGRAEIGVGKGNFSIEKSRLGLDDASTAARFGEGLKLLTAAMSDSDITHDGEYYQITQPSTVYPRPYPGLRPWVAALSPKSIAAAGAGGHNLMSFMGWGSHEILSTYVEAGEKNGHELSGGANFMTNVSIIVAPTEAEAKETQSKAKESAWETMMRRGLPKDEAERFLPRFSGAVVGTPQQVVEQLSHDVGIAGARRLNVIMRLRSIPRQASEQTMRMFAAEVMPELRKL